MIQNDKLGLSFASLKTGTLLLQPKQMAYQQIQRTGKTHTTNDFGLTAKHKP